MGVLDRFIEILIKQRSQLVPKLITDKRGFKRKVWVKPEEAAAAPEPAKQVEVPQQQTKAALEDDVSSRVKKVLGSIVEDVASGKGSHQYAKFRDLRNKLQKISEAAKAAGNDKLSNHASEMLDKVKQIHETKGWNEKHALIQGMLQEKPTVPTKTPTELPHPDQQRALLLIAKIDITQDDINNPEPKVQNALKQKIIDIRKQYYGEEDFNISNELINGWEDTADGMNMIKSDVDATSLFTDNPETDKKIIVLRDAFGDTFFNNTLGKLKEILQKEYHLTQALMTHLKQDSITIYRGLMPPQKSDYIDEHLAAYYKDQAVSYEKIKSYDEQNKQNQEYHTDMFTSASENKEIAQSYALQSDDKLAGLLIELEVPKKNLLFKHGITNWTKPQKETTLFGDVTIKQVTNVGDFYLNHQIESINNIKQDLIDRWTTLNKKERKLTYNILNLLDDISNSKDTASKINLLEFFKESNPNIVIQSWVPDIPLE